MILLVLYIISLSYLGFLLSSIVFVFLFNILYSASKDKKTILTSVVISVVSSVAIWYVFGVVFNVSLPTSVLFNF